MYQYTAAERQLLDERVAQFRGQVQRYLAGQLSDEEFLPLRLQNGLYVQRLAPMLRVAIPYGMLSSRQLRTLAAIASDFDKGYGHISTRQNIQFNWPELADVPDILERLAEVEMHAIQTSGNCVRNISCDPRAGDSPDELEDPRPWCEVIRQWACFHPEFSFLPRKFKIAVNGAASDRAAIAVHDIGLWLRCGADGETGFGVVVGGGLGRTPVIGPVIREFLPWRHLLSYLEAILRVYNLLGRRDNKYKARIKILARALGPEEFTRRVEAEWEAIRREQPELELSERQLRDIRAHFATGTLPRTRLDAEETARLLAQERLASPAFNRWLKHNTAPHRSAAHTIVTLALKSTGMPPGDISDWQMNLVADLAESYASGEIRTTHEQNLLLSGVPREQLPELWRSLETAELATPNAGTINDSICCPGGDYCSLANARSIPLAEALQRRCEELDYFDDLGPIDLNISGCMNACGHHHVGHIGILGVDKKGREFYQILLGGNAGYGHSASLGTILGPSMSAAQTVAAVTQILEFYMAERQAEEPFLDAVRRLGIAPFRNHIYAHHH